MLGFWDTSIVSAAGEQRFGSSEGEHRLVVAGIVGTCVLVLAQTAAQLVDYGFDLRIEVINSDGDGGVFGIIGVVALSWASAAAWAALPRLRTARRPLELVAPVLTFLAFDKALRLHDHVPHWLVLYLPLLVGVFLLLFEIARRTSLHARRLIVAALLLLGVAFVVHQYGESVLVRAHAPPTGWLYQLKGVTKHGAELAGWLLIGLGLLVACLSPGERARSTPPAELADSPSG